MKMSASLFRNLLVLTLCQFLLTGLWAQKSLTIKGRVLDDENQPLAGVSIRLKGTKVGTTTDEKGNYVLTVNNPEGVLVFSFVGFQPLEESINRRSTLNTSLQSTTSTLGQVVVVAYGTQKKATVTGALTTVQGEELAKSPTPNLAQAIVGRTSGILAQQNSGQPGVDEVSILIRGSSTFNNNSAPLILVDGVERPFNSINPEEVENITILKDAATTAVYGIRGANGVILVTTKRGKAGKPRISLTSNMSVQTPTRLPEFANAHDYAFLYNEALYNDNPNQPPLFTEDDLQKFKDGSDPIFHPDIDWFDFMMKDRALQSKNTITINGGGQLAKYFISLGYMDQGGLWKEFNKQFGYSNNTNYKRYNFRSSVDLNLSRSTSFGFSIGGYSDKHHTASNPFYGIQNTPAGITPGLVDDKIIINTSITGRNPLVPISGGFDERFRSQLNMTADLNQKLDVLTKGLSIRAKMGYDSDYGTLISQSITRTTYEPLRINVNGKDTIVFRPNNDQTIGGVSSQSFNSRSKRVYFETALEYSQRFGKNAVSGLLLYNQNKQYWPAGSYRVEVPEVPIGYLGVVGRVTYNYDLRYLLEFSIGRNGSENFPSGKRFGTFPAVSVGWNATREPFMKALLGESTVLSNLKFRASYGETGNDKLIDGNNIYQRFMYFPSEYIFVNNRAPFGEDLRNYQGLTEGQLGNPDITWEKAIKKNYAVEAGFLNNKLNLKFDYFIDYRNNILYQKPSIAHVAAAIQDVYNTARIRNRGYEVELGWNHSVGDVKYYINGNYTFARNKVLENGTPPSPQNQLGNPLNQTYGLIALGFFNTQEEADAWPLQYSARSTPGDVKYADSNGDGKVDQDDFVPIGYPVFPEVSYGTSLGASYKGFDFSMLFQGAARVSRMISGFMQRPANQYGTTLAVVMQERWTPDNAAHATRPKLTATYANSTNYQNSTLWMRDGSYLRLKNAELGYRFNDGLLKKAGIQSARLYVSGQNLVTWDKLKIVDPEQQASNAFSYPQLQIFNAGVNIQF